MNGYFHNVRTNEKANFLESETGIVLKTARFDNTEIEADKFGYKIIKAGTVYPNDSAEAKGIVFEDVDVTYGSKAGSIIVAGRVLKDRLDISDTAVMALSKLGILFCDSVCADRTQVFKTEDTAADSALDKTEDSK